VVVASAAPVVWPEARAVLEAGGVEIVPATLREAEEAEVIVSGGLPLDAAVFARLGRARFVLRPYVGYDDVDVEAATRHGILVANVPDTFVEEVANHALALILAANRRLLGMDRFVRDGRWAAGEDPWVAARPVARLSLMTLGLVGFGNIGRLVAARARPFGFRLLAADPYVAAETAAEHGARLVPLDDLLRESDVVSVHVLLTRETRHLLDGPRLALMKPTAVLVNTARGPVVDEAALVEALRSGRLAGAALDVFEAEPLDPGSPLARLPEVILAPHLGSYSVEGVPLHRARVGQLALQGATGLPERRVILNKPLYDRVAALPECAAVRRY
jgi:D-3-phosphoglycerate dehydrogenase